MSQIVTKAFVFRNQQQGNQQQQKVRGIAWSAQSQWQPWSRWIGNILELEKPDWRNLATCKSRSMNSARPVQPLSLCARAVATLGPASNHFIKPSLIWITIAFYISRRHIVFCKKGYCLPWRHFSAFYVLVSFVIN